MKKTISVMTVMAVIIPLLTVALVAQAQPGIGLNYAASTGLQATNEDPRVVAVNIVKYLMTFLGIIAVVVILLGGFKWMTAAGNEDKVGEAKKLIVAGIIGLIIILSAFAIVTFVVNTTQDVLTGTL